MTAGNPIPSREEAERSHAAERDILDVLLHHELSVAGSMLCLASALGNLLGSGPQDAAEEVECKIFHMIRTRRLDPTVEFVFVTEDPAEPAA